MIRPYGEPSSRLTAAARVEANTAAPGLRTSSPATTAGIRYTPLRIAASGGKKSSGAASTPKTRFQAQKATPKATPRTAATTMSTVRQRTLRPAPVPADDGRTAWSAMDPSRLPAPALPGSGSRVCGVPHSQRRGAPLSDVFCCAAELSLLAPEPGEERLAVGHAQAGAGV